MSTGALDKQEWLRRYQQRFVDVAKLDADAARQCAECETFERLSEGFEDDPEGAADEEMSYWDGD